jgi:hypothetical protein
MKDFIDSQFKPDFEIADKYISFSSEILRLSLLGITAIATFFGFYLNRNCACPLAVVITSYESLFLIVTIILFTLSAGFALAHRFFATDSLTYLISKLRTNDKNESKGLIRILKRAGSMLIFAEWTFGFGVFTFVVSLIILILSLIK